MWNRIKSLFSDAPQIDREQLDEGQQPMGSTPDSPLEISPN